MTEAKQDYLLGNRLYDTLKSGTVVVLPAAGTLYFALSQIWGFPNGEEVVGTIAAVNVFLGVVLKVGDVSYSKSDAKYDGEINVSVGEDGTRRADLNLKNYEDPAEVINQPEALFKVNRNLL